jgi:hypothetical protein
MNARMAVGEPALIHPSSHQRCQIFIVPVASDGRVGPCGAREWGEGGEGGSGAERRDCGWLIMVRELLSTFTAVLSLGTYGELIGLARIWKCPVCLVLHLRRSPYPITNCPAHRFAERLPHLYGQRLSAPSRPRRGRPQAFTYA